MGERLRFDVDRLIDYLWGFVLLCLPITTFKFFPSVFQSSQSRFLALYPLSVLVLLLMYKQLRNKNFKFSPVLIPLLAFLVITVFSSVWGSHLVPLEIHGTSYFARTFKGWISLGIGLSFFYAAFSMVQDERSLKKSFKWFFAGFGISALVGVLQIIAIQSNLLDYEKINRFFSYILIQTDHTSRISGLAFEPSWFADQLVILYFPWLFAGFVFNTGIAKKKYLDWLAMILLIILLVFTYSRSGIMNLGISVVITLLLTGRVWWPSLRKNIKFFFTNNSNRVFRNIKIAGLVLLVIVIGLIFIFAMSKYDYFANILNFDEGETLFDYLINISIGPRVGYAISAFEVYEENSVFGVGLGASGLHMYFHFPDWLKTFSMETEHYFDPAYSIIPNPKNLYIKLLSETGIIGFWLFISFHIAVLGQCLKLFVSKDQFRKQAGFVGILFWFLLSIRFFTMDSFASPVVWVNMGILIGLSGFNKNEGIKKG